MSRQTVVSIQGDNFYLNGRPTYEGRIYQEMRIEGLLLNSRMVQGIFDDLNPHTRSLWDYPDGPWDPERNTRAFVAAMPLWRAHGLLGFTLNLQGGSPQGYRKDQPWHNSAFTADGALRPAYMARLELILDQADLLGMVPTVGFFYWGQVQRFSGEEAVLCACDYITDWLLAKEYTHVLIEIGNGVDITDIEPDLRYAQAIIAAPRSHELIERVQQRSQGKVMTPAGRLLVSTSFNGIVTEPVAAAADFLLLHGNGVPTPDGVRQRVDQCRALPAYHGQPIVFNEDDHDAFDAPDNHLLAATGAHASWGFYDYRREGEGWGAGYQDMSTDWGINTARKRGFFDLIRRLTGI